MVPNTTTNTNSRKVTTKVDDKKTKVSKKTKVVSTKTSSKTTNRAGTRISTKTNTRISTKTTITVEKTIKKTTTTTTTTTTTETETNNETPQCRAFYKFSDTPTTEWASALRDLYHKGIILLRGPHNAFGYPINLGFQPCGCRVSWGIVNRLTVNPCTGGPSFRMAGELTGTWSGEMFLESLYSTPPEGVEGGT